MNTNEAHLSLLYAPSPVPDQIARTNYVDNSRLGLALSAGKTLKISSRKMRILVNTQAQYLVPRDTSKDLQAIDPVFDEYPDAVHYRSREAMPESGGFQSNNPGFPGFSSNGLLLSMGISFQSYF